MIKKLLHFNFLLIFCFSVNCLEVDSGLEDYTKKSGISGNLNTVGSDTLANLMTLWAEFFRKIYPSVNIQIQAAGSSTAPPALTEGTSNFGPMSRKMKSKERPFVLFVAEIIYKKICEIKKKILNFQKSTQLIISLGLKLIMILAVVNFMKNGLSN